MNLQAQAHRILELIEAGQLVSATTPDGDLIIHNDAKDQLVLELAKFFASLVKTACSNPEVMDEAAIMLKIGVEKGDLPQKTISIAISTAMLLALGIHPTYGTIEQLAAKNAADLLTEYQQRAVRIHCGEEGEWKPQGLARFLKVIHQSTNEPAYIDPEGRIYIPTPF